jgi:hypothetical protein
MSFLALESEMRCWESPGPGATPGSMVAYVDTGRAWVAAGSPLAAPSRLAETAHAFVQEAKKRRRRACFFACEARALPGFSRLLLGEQPVWTPASWRVNVATHRRLREQIRRAAAKGVVVRRVAPSDLAAGTPLRVRVDSLARAWLATRRMAPMGFLVAMEPFHAPEEHLYFVAEREGELVQFMSAVPVYARPGWLLEDVARSPGAPNGTTEALLDRLMREVGEDETVTLGLAPLSGPVSRWLRVARFVSRPMFDFAALRSFRQRLRPLRWEGVWLFYSEGDHPAVHLLDCLRAFARGSLVSFGIRTIARRPSGPPWALALPLAPWTLLLAALTTTGHARVIGFSTPALAGWAGFDAILSVLLFWTALRPKRSRLALAAAAAWVDAAASVPHLAVTGLGEGVASHGLRLLAAIAPCLAAGILGWLALRSTRP